MLVCLFIDLASVEFDSTPRQPLTSPNSRRIAATTRLVNVLLGLRSDFRCDLESQRIQPNESGGVILIVGLGGVGLHRCDLGIVEADRTPSSRRNDVPFVELEADRAGHILL